MRYAGWAPCSRARSPRLSPKALTRYCPITSSPSPQPRTQVVAVYGLLDVADKGRRAYAAETAAAAAPTSAPHGAGPVRLPAAAAAAAASAARTPALLPELQPVRGVAPASTSRALAQTAAGVAAACAACLPPRAAYAAAAASIFEQGPSVAPVAAEVLHTALWHGAASLALPAVLINRCAGGRWASLFEVGAEPLPEAIQPAGQQPTPARPPPPSPTPPRSTVWATRQLLSSASCARLPARARALAPSAAGLALIPLVVPHIDQAVSQLLDAHLRPCLPQARVARSAVPDAS